MSFPIISADSHITEPANTYLDHIEPTYRDRAPRMGRNDATGGFFVIDGMKTLIVIERVAAADKTLPSTEEMIGNHEGMDERQVNLEAYRLDCRLLRPAPRTTSGHRGFISALRTVSGYKIQNGRQPG